jgi:hypothetical protein
MQRVPGWLLLAAAWLVAPPSRLRGQTPAPQDTASLELPRVFVDCQASGCDENFLKTELAWIIFLRERNAAGMYILLTERQTGGGGREFSALFQGQGPLAGRSDTLVAIAPQGSTPDELRRIVARTIAQGMLRFVRELPVIARLNVTYQAPRGQSASATRGARDRWNLWVFRIGLDGFGSGDANYKSTYLFSSVRATRTTAAWKSVLAFGYDYEENKYVLTDSTSEINRQRGWNADFLQVKSLGEHWSVGAQVNAYSSYYTNTDLSLRFSPSIEYDVVPYSQSTRHQLVFRYGVGIRKLDYGDTTIFDKVRETRPDHRLVVATDIRRGWGNVGGAVVFSQYLHDLSKRNVDISGNIRWRVFTGFEFGISGGYTQIRDQLYLPKTDLSDEDILIRLRQLQTGYRYYGSVNVSYTFGSVFNTVVNPRFTQRLGGG